MNKLTESMGLDPVEIRMRNLLGEGDLLSVGTPLPKGVTISKVVENCAVAAGWQHGEQGWYHPGKMAQTDPVKAHLKRGLGFACSYKNVGFSFGAPEQSWATVELRGDTEIEQAVV